MIDNNSISKDKIYNRIKPELALQDMNNIQKLMDLFLEKSKLTRDDIRYNDVMLAKIVIRIDQRRDYFVYFHSEKQPDGSINIDEMSQYKQLALLCFWIIKYKPFSIIEAQAEMDYYAQNHCTINETFAAYIFVSQLNNCKILKQKQKKYYCSKEYLSDLFYKFMHHDISKESMIFALSSVVCCK